VSTLCILIGNPLRGDDGVAHRVADLLGTFSGVALLCSQQLTPELSEKVGRVRNVIFVDADVTPGHPYIEAIATQRPRGSPLTHALSPGEVICLATRLFGFDGLAFVCHVPGVDFKPGEGLSADAEANAECAMRMIAHLLRDARG
jgi:hydrogenase maturation protease